MTNEKEKSEIIKEVKILEEKIILLEEELRLRQKSWLLRHHLLFSIGLGITYGSIISMIHYLAISYLGSQTYVTNLIVLGIDLVVFLFIMLWLSIPIFATLPLVIALKAPDFVYRSLKVYLFSFSLFEVSILYLNPLKTLGPMPMDFILSFVLIQAVIIGFFLIFVPQIAKFF